MDKKISKEVRRYLERELKDYRENKELIKELRLDIIDSSPNITLGVPGSPNKGNEGQTSKVYELITNNMINRLQTICRKIENVLSELDDIRYEFYIRCFEKRQSKVKICMEMPIAEKTYYRYKKYIINKLAEELGYI